MTNSLTWSLYGKDVSASSALKGVAESGEKTNNVFKTMAGVAGGALAAMGVSNVMGAVKGFLSDSVEAYKEATTAQLRLQDAYVSFPAIASVSIESLRALNTELMNKTRFDDDALASGQSVLAQFGLTGEQLAQLTPLLADFAAKTGQDLPTAADALGKALLGQGRALKGVGIDFQDAGSTAANFDQLVAGLRTQVGGFAEKEATDGAGKAERFKNQLGELQETIGAGLLPVIYGLQGALLDNLVPALSVLAQGFADNVGPAFEKMMGFVGPLIQQLGQFFAPILSTLGPQVLQLAMAFSPLHLILTALQPVLPILGSMLQQVAGILSGVLTAALPVVTSLIGSLAGIISGVLAQVLPIIARLIGDVGAVLKQIMPAIVAVAGAIGGALLSVLGALAPVIPIIVGVVMQLFEALMPLIAPILQIVMAFMPLITILGQLLGELLPPIIELFMAILQPIMSLITPLIELLVPVLGWVADALSVVISWLIEFLPSMDAVVPVIKTVAAVIRDVLGGIAGFVGDVFHNVANFVVAGINQIIDLVNGAVGLVNDLGRTAASVSGGAISWKVAALPRIPMLAEGAIATAATIAMIGEGSEPEVVAPLSKLPDLMRSAGLAGDNSGGGTTLIFQGVPDELARLFNVYEQKADGSRVLVSKMGKQVAK